MTREEKIMMQQQAFAVLACNKLGYDVEKASKVLAMPIPEVDCLYGMINSNLINFESDFEE